LNLRTTHAVLIAIGLLTASYVWATFFPTAPFQAFATTLGLVFGAYAGKRLLQKKEEFVEKDS